MLLLGVLSGGDFDPSGEQSDQAKKPNTNKKWIRIAVAAVGGIIFIIFLFDSSLLRTQLGTANPLVAAGMTDEQKALITQANAEGSDTLFQCTPMLPKGSLDCDYAIKDLYDVCSSNIHNFVNFCNDARLSNYINNRGGADQLIQRIADHEARVAADKAMMSKVARDMADDAKFSTVANCGASLPYGTADCDSRMEDLHTTCVNDSTHTYCAKVNSYYKYRYDEEAHNQMAQDQQDAQEAYYKRVNDEERQNSSIQLEELQACLNTLPHGTTQCDQSTGFVIDDCAARKTEIPRIEYLAQKCNSAQKYYDSVDWVWRGEQKLTLAATKIFLYLSTHDDAFDTVGLDNQRWTEILSSMSSDGLDAVTVDKVEYPDGSFPVVYLSMASHNGTITLSANPLEIVRIQFDGNAMNH